jgi:peptidyl-prolyl cis-trans isomerase C
MSAKSAQARILFAALMLSALSAPAFAASSSTTSDASASAGDPVVARVNGSEIHKSDLLHELQLMGPQAQQMPPQMVYPQLLQKMIATKLVSAQGYAEGLQNDKDVKAQVKDAEAQIVAEAYVHKSIQPKITDAKIKERYEQLAAKFKPSDEVRARHILVKVAPNASPDEVSKAQDKANDIIKQLKGGADFAKLAEQSSDDTGSAKQGGDLGYFGQGQMVKPFADAAFAMKVGDISDKPVKTEFGFHIIKVEDKRKSAPPPVSEVHDQIANQLGQDMTNDLVKGLEAKAKIEKFNLDGTPMKAAAATDTGSDSSK